MLAALDNPLTYIAVLVNPTRSSRKLTALTIAIKTFLNAHKVSSIVFDNQWPYTLDSFTEIWIVGGDGTFNYFLNAYPLTSVPIVLFKGGTGNDFAWKLYGDMSTQQQLQHITHAEVKPVDVGICNGKKYINCLGLGFDGKVLQAMKLIRFLGGHCGYLAAVIKTIISYQEKEFHITCCNITVRKKLLLLAINNANRTGGGFLITPDARINDGILDLLTCEPLSIFKRLRYLPLIQKGKHLNLSFIELKQIKHCLIKTTSVVSGQIDGEIITGDSFDISIPPGAINIRY